MTASVMVYFHRAYLNSFVGISAHVPSSGKALMYPPVFSKR